MAEELDVKGLTCPLPVLRVKKRMRDLAAGAELRVLATIAAGGNPGAESSVLKIATVDIEQRIHELGIDLLGHRALVFTNDIATTAATDTGIPALAAGFLGRYLNGRAASIFGGSHEVQRNIIAKSVLGL